MSCKRLERNKWLQNGDTKKRIEFFSSFDSYLRYFLHRTKWSRFVRFFEVQLPKNTRKCGPTLHRYLRWLNAQTIFSARFCYFAFQLVYIWRCKPKFSNSCKSKFIGIKHMDDFRFLHFHVKLNLPKQDGKNDDRPENIKNVEFSYATFSSIFTITKNREENHSVLSNIYIRKYFTKK